MSEPKPIITVQNLHKSFNSRVGETKVLKDISTVIYKGEFLIVFGPSGSGKSTLLHTITGLEQPTSGTVTFLEENLYKLSADELSVFRVKNIGIVYQQPIWIKALNVIDNTAFPLTLRGVSRKEALQVAYEKLEMFTMRKWAKYLPMELSSGQQQLISLARALVTNPKVIVTDEPTGNLDHDASQHLIQVLTSLRKEGTTVITVTHDLQYLSYADRTLYLKDGMVAGEYSKEETSTLFKNIFMTGQPDTNHA